MDRKAASGIMLTLLLVSVIHFAAANSVARATGFNGDLQNYEIFSETEDWWVMFHHDLNHTGYSNSTVPIPLMELWNSRGIINGSVRSSPAIVGDKVFVGSSDNNVYVLNAMTGEYMWNYTTDGAVESSPAVVGDMVFVGSMNGTVYAWSVASPHGPEWNFTTGGAVRSSPAIADSMVFFGSLDGYVYALPRTDPDGNGIIDPEEVKWKFWMACPVYSSPAVSGGRVFIGASDGRVYALNVTGRYEWHFDTGDSVESSPAVADGKVFVGSDSGKVYALNETTGEEIWSNSTGGAVKSSPAVADGRVFIGSMNGSVYALNATTGNILWNSTTEGFVYSSPAIAGGKVFVGSGDNKTYILNATDGSLIWNLPTDDPIYSSPAVAKNMVFIGSDDMKVYAIGPKNKEPQPNIELYPTEPFILQTVTFNGSASYDPDGFIVSYKWDFGDGETVTGVNATHAYGAADTYTVTLTVTDDHPTHPKTNITSQLVTVQEAWPMYRHDWNHKGNSTSLAPVTNRTLWTLKIGPDESWDPLMYSSPAVIDGVVYIGSTNGTVYALNATDRSVIWNSTPGGRIHSSPAVADGIVFIGSDDGNVYALNATDGSRMWTGGTDGPIESSPAVAYDMVFIGSQDRRVYAFDKNSGSLKWRYDTGGVVYSSPAVADGKVYIGSWDDKVYALKAKTSESTGELIWERPLSDDIQSSPTVAYDMVFVGTIDGKVYGLNATTGSVIWSYPTGGIVDSSPAVAEGKVFIGSDDGNVYALNATTGEKIWNKTIGSVGWSSPAVVEGKVFIGSTNGIFALHEEDGKEVWSYQTGGSVDSSPAVLNDTLYVASKKGMLYAFWNKTHDIAVLEVIPSPDRVPQNGTVKIEITLENQGSFNETNLNVTAYYFNETPINVANSAVINLTRQSKKTIHLLWDTTGLAEGIYTINATAPLALDEDPYDNYLIYENVTIGGKRDINVTDVWLGYNVTDPAHRVKTVVCQGYNVTIYVTVKNEGDLYESIEVIAYWSNSSPFNQTIGSAPVELPTNASITVSILWNTNATGVPLSKGNYTITAYVAPLLGETDTADNTPRDGWVMVTMAGDINNDGKVDMKDLTKVAIAYGSSPSTSDPPWNPDADLNNDDRVNIADLTIIAKHWGETDP